MPEANYHALHQRRLTLLKEGKKLRQIEDPSEEDIARMNAIADEVDAVDAKLQSIGRLHELERNTPAATAPANVGSAITVRDRTEDDPNRGFTNLAEFALSVRSAGRSGNRIDPRLLPLHREGDTSPRAAPTGYHEEGHASEGYMVPVGMRSAIWEIALGNDDLFGMIGAEQTEGTSVQWARDETTPWGSTGIQAVWRAEASQMTPSKLVTDPSTLNLHELYAFATATAEILHDAPLLNSRLTRGAGRALQWEMSQALMRGTGAGQPLGWLSAPCLISVTRNTASTILAEDLLGMFTRRLVMPGSRWTWLANIDIVPKLVDLKIGNEPSWVGQNRGLREAPDGMILGLPLRFTEHCSTLGTVGDIQLVDLAGYYAINQAEGIKFDTSIHLYFDYNVDAFRWIVRIGGQPFLSAAVSPAHGSTTKSSFVALAT